MNIKLVLLLFLSLTIVACSSTPTTVSWDEELQQAANDLNKGLPMMVDAETRLDSSMAMMNTFTYRYTMVNFANEDLNIEQFTDIMTKQITNTVCTSPDMVAFRDNGTLLNYLYVDKNSKHLTKIEIKTTECPKS